MTLMSPPGREQIVAEAQETKTAAEARYKDIATSIINVVYTEDETPLFGGMYSRPKTALFIAFKFYMESGFRRDVHLGLGRERLGRSGWNDHGRSWCMGQIMLGKRGDDSANTTPEGWSGKDLVQDTTKCVLATLHTLRRSMHACSGLPQAERLAAYASGSCDSERGKQISRNRMQAFQRWWAKGKDRYPQLNELSSL
jgi:hypothetical protein